MDQKAKVLIRLNDALKVLVKSDVEEALESAGLNTLIGRSIPGDVLRMYANKKYIDQNLSRELLGFFAIDFEELRAGVNPNQSLEKYAGDLITGHGIEYTRYIMIDGLDGELSADLVLRNLDALFPVMSDGLGYIFFHVSADPQIHGLYEERFGYGNMFAPSLEAHIIDLIEGVESGIYPINEDGYVVFPSSWHYRKKLAKGLVTMDEDGSVSDPEWQ